MSRYIDAEDFFRTFEELDIEPYNNFQTADVAPVVHGEWIDVNDDGSLLECGNCHETSCCRGSYCPNCGAKMDERREDGE